MVFSIWSRKQTMNLQCQQLTSQRPNEPRKSKSQMKTRLMTFFDINGADHFEFILRGRKVDQADYMEMLKRLCENVCRKWPEHWPNHWILHSDNAPVHKTLSSKIFWLKNRLLKWNTHPVPWFGSEWRLALSENKVCLKWTKISRYWRH